MVDVSTPPGTDDIERGDGLPTVDRERAAAAVRELLLALGEDPDREGLVDTPMRVAKAFEETFAGLRQDPAEILSRTFSIDHDELIAPRRRGQARARTPEAQRRRRKRRTVLAAVIAVMLVAVVGVGYYGLRATGMLDSRKDYTNAAGTGDVIVDIPQNSTLKDYGRILADDNVLIMAGKTFRRVEVPTPAGGVPRLCIRVPGPGAYAVTLLHDRDGNRKFNWTHDGIGFSANPKLGWSKPKARSVTAQAGSGPTPLRIVLNYRNGLASVGPIKGS